MNKALFVSALKLAVPALLGALGGIFAATYPALHSSFCGVPL